MFVKTFVDKINTKKHGDKKSLKNLPHLAVWVGPHLHGAALHVGAFPLKWTMSQYCRQEHTLSLATKLVGAVTPISGKVLCSDNIFY